MSFDTELFLEFFDNDFQTEGERYLNVYLKYRERGEPVPEMALKFLDSAFEKILYQRDTVSLESALHLTKKQGRPKKGSDFGLKIASDVYERTHRKGRRRQSILVATREIGKRHSVSRKTAEKFYYEHKDQIDRDIKIKEEVDRRWAVIEPFYRALGDEEQIQFQRSLTEGLVEMGFLKK